MGDPKRFIGPKINLTKSTTIHVFLPFNLRQSRWLKRFAMILLPLDDHDGD